MVTRRENIRKYIQVIINQSPRHFPKYSVEDQKFLTLFLKPLNHYEEADNNREKLANRLHNARLEFAKSNIYLKHPFSWFAVSYFENAEVALRTSTFHADPFFDYLLPILKGTAGQDNGFFQLIRKGTSLEDLKWEKLQYLSSKLRVTLSTKQLQLLTTIYDLIDHKPWNILRPRRLRSILLDQNSTPKLSRELPKLFSMLNAFWTVWPYYPAFGLQTYFFQCKLPLNVKLEDIIDFQDNHNYILQTSIISTVRNAQNEYIGAITLPEDQQSAMEDYLNLKMSENLIDSFKLKKIFENRWSYSLAQYQNELGWEEIQKSQWDQDVHIIKLTNLPRRRKAVNLAYLAPKVQNSWTFRQLKDPYSAIELICKKNDHTFNDLVTETYPSTDFALLKKLFEKNVLFLDFNPVRLRDEYSLDVYWIEAPKISLYQLKRFLQLVPYARTAITKNHCYIRTHLSDHMVHRITKDLQWKIYPLLPAHNVHQRNTGMFNEKSVSWRSPKILTE